MFRGRPNVRPRVKGVLTRKVGRGRREPDGKFMSDGVIPEWSTQVVVTRFGCRVRGLSLVRSLRSYNCMGAWLPGSSK